MQLFSDPKKAKTSPCVEAVTNFETGNIRWLFWNWRAHKNLIRIQIENIWQGNKLRIILIYKLIFAESEMTKFIYFCKPSWTELMLNYSI